MLKSFKTKGWKRWDKSTKQKGEVVKYAAFHNEQKDRIVLFESGAEMISNFKKNHKKFGGDAWDKSSHFDTEMDKSNTWRFGTDFDTLRKTNEAIENGSMAELYLERKDSITQQLFDEFPELYELSVQATEKRMRKEYAEEGDEMDMDRFMDGDDKMWMRKKKRDTQVLAARVYIDICVAGATSTEVVTTNMLYSVVICEILQKSGLPLEIIVGATSLGATSDANLYNVSIVAKRHDEPLDVSRLLTFALPGVFRQYIFGTWENITDGRADYGLGVVQNEHGIKPITNFMDADIVIIGGDSVMNHTKLAVIIDKVAKMLNLQLKGSGFAHYDGEHDSSKEERSHDDSFDEANKTNNGDDDWINDHIKNAMNSSDDDNDDEDDEWNPDEDNWGEGWE